MSVVNRTGLILRSASARNHQGRPWSPPEPLHGESGLTRTTSTEGYSLASPEQTAAGLDHLVNRPHPPSSGSGEREIVEQLVPSRRG